jgi:hypothetical protein
VDVAVERVYDFSVDPLDPDLSKLISQAERDGEIQSVSDLRNAPLPKRSDLHPELLDFYNTFDELEVTEGDRRDYLRLMRRLESDDRAFIERIQERPLHFNVVRFRNHGGVVMPLPLSLTWEDGTVEEVMLPAEIWKRNPVVFSKLFVSHQPLASVHLDIRREIADADRTNNAYPPEVITGRFPMEASSRRDRGNPMRSELEEEARGSTRQNAFRAARTFVVSWAGIEDPETPVDHTATFMAALDEGRAVDAWGHPFGLTWGSTRSDDDGSGQDLFVELLSPGPDGESGTDDDVAFWMNMLGEFNDGPFIRDQAGDGR